MLCVLWEQSDRQKSDGVIRRMKVCLTQTGVLGWPHFRGLSSPFRGVSVTFGKAGECARKLNLKNHHLAIPNCTVKMFQAQDLQ